MAVHSRRAGEYFGHRHLALVENERKWNTNMGERMTNRRFGISLSLARGFSRVSAVGGRGKPFQRFFRSRASMKPLKRLGPAPPPAPQPRLKPGANEMPIFSRGNLSTRR